MQTNFEWQQKLWSGAAASFGDAKRHAVQQAQKKTESIEAVDSHVCVFAV